MEFRWISKDEALPPLNKRVLVSNGKIVTLGKFTDVFVDKNDVPHDRWECITEYTMVPRKWMPIPGI